MRIVRFKVPIKIDYIYSAILVDLNACNRDDAASMDSFCYFSKSETFLETKYVLIGKHSSSGQLKRGHYLLPFRLAVRQNIPGTFHHHENSSELHGRIIYVVEVEVGVPGLILKKNLRSDPYEVIRQLANDPIMPVQIVDEINLKSFWVCSGGNVIELAVALDKNYYAPGDRISLKFALNSPLSNIKYVQVSLKRHIRIGPIEKCRRDKKVLGRVNTGRISGCIERRAMFFIPESEHFSVLNGKLIECRYELEFKIRGDWCFASYFRYNLVVNDSLLPTYEQFKK